MLYVKYVDSVQPIELHVGDIVRESFSRSAPHVQWVQADGDELVHIQHQFYSSFPLPNRPVSRWFGDFAKMIVGNW